MVSLPGPAAAALSGTNSDGPTKGGRRLSSVWPCKETGQGKMAHHRTNPENPCVQIGQGWQRRARERAIECRPREPALSEIGLCIVESGALLEIRCVVGNRACVVGNRVRCRKSGLALSEIGFAVQSPKSSFCLCWRCSATDRQCVLPRISKRPHGKDETLCYAHAPPEEECFIT